MLEILRSFAKDDGIKVEISTEVVDEVLGRRGGREGKRGKNFLPEEKLVSEDEGTNVDTGVAEEESECNDIAGGEEVSKELKE